MPARNVLNHAEVDRLIDGLAQPIKRPELEDWLRTTVRRWILKYHDRYRRVARDPVSGEFALVVTDVEGATTSHGALAALPEWCGRALARGDEVVVLDLGATLRKRLRRTLTAVEASLKEGTLATVERLSFPLAETMARDARLRDYETRRAQRIHSEALPVYSAERATIVRLVTPESLADEGRRMHHCVGNGNYACWVRDGSTEIYSLRDEKGRSRATLEVESDGTLWQIKGFANGQVDDRYRPILQSFVRRRAYDVRADGHNLVVRPEAFKTDVARLESYLVAGGGFARLQRSRWAGYDALCGVELPILLRTLAANARELDPAIISTVFAALAPSDKTLVQIWLAGEVRAYGTTIQVHRVRLPLPLINLIRLGAFCRGDRRAEAQALFTNLENALTGLSLQRPDRLFVLGPAGVRQRWSGALMASPADVLLCSRVDVARLRDRRHSALRRHLNQARRTWLGKRSKASDAHLYVRRLLDGAFGDYVL